MSRRLPPVNWLRTFEAAARHLSFTGAARELGITQSAVSQQVRLLERQLGRTLFHRLPRGLALAEAGEAYLPLVAESFDRLEGGTTEIFGRRTGDRLSIRATTGFAVFWLAPRLPGFATLHPEVGVRITTANWPVEYPDEHIDLEIRYGDGIWSGLRAERLSWDEVFPVCSPKLAAGPLPLAAPSDLAQHTLLHAIGFREGWAQWLEEAGVEQMVDARRGLEFDTSVVAIGVALEGAGIALGRTCYVERLLRSGDLVEPFGLRLSTEEAFYLVSPEGKADSPAAEQFRRWILAQATASAAPAHTRRRGAA